MSARRPTRSSYIEYASDPDARLSIGGAVIKMKAAAALKLWDVVYLSAALTVNKSATVGNHSKRIGVVVGGANTDNTVVTDSALYDSMTVADADEDVLVQVAGIAYVIAGGTVNAGDRVIPDTGTAGRVKAGAVITATAANPTQAASSVDSGAVAVTSTAANGNIITNGAITAGAITMAGDGMNTILGVMLEGATAGQIKRCLLTLS
jgi:hypothetical protein